MANFVALEAALLDCLDYIPYVSQNLTVVSPRFIPLLLEACSLLDSVFRYIVGDGQRHTFGSYPGHIEPVLELQGTTTLVLVAPLQLVRPFQGWTSAAPTWWNAYNQVKHDRIRNYSAASLTATVTAIAGLHQVLSRSKTFLGQTTKAGWFNESDDVHFAELLTCGIVGSGMPDMAAESRLFVSSTRGDFVDWTTDPPTIEQWEFSARTKNHLWEREGWL